MIAEQLRKYLVGIPAIANRLSAEKWGVKIRKNRIPQGMPLPYVRLQQISGSPDYHLAGEIGDCYQIVQVDVWAETEAEADQIAELVRLAPLSGYWGAWDGTKINAVTIVNEISDEEPPGDASDAWKFRSQKDYRINFERPIPA